MVDSTTPRADVLQLVQQCTAIAPRRRPDMAKVEQAVMNMRGRKNLSRTKSRHSTNPKMTVLPIANRLPAPGAAASDRDSDDGAATIADEAECDVCLDENMDRCGRARRLSAMRL